MSIAIAQSTPTAASIGEIVSTHYSLGKVVGCEFLRRSFNQVYGLNFADGRRAVARLSADRPRGEPNLAYEAALLDHLRNGGLPVAACLRSALGGSSISLELPEGPRPLMLFDFLDGEFPGESLVDIEAFGRGLATLHKTAESFQGTSSLYTLDLDYLLERPLSRLLQSPTMTDELRSPFAALASRLRQRITATSDLTWTVCHGDAHGQNNFVTDGASGERIASFFDFDEAGPGYLAYELAVYAWAMHPRTVEGELDEKAAIRWRSFINSYQTIRSVAPADLQAINSFMAVRQFWLLGEYAGRIPVWGSQAMPTSYLRKQMQMLTRWETQAPILPSS